MRWNKTVSIHPWVRCAAFAAAVALVFSGCLSAPAAPAPDRTYTVGAVLKSMDNQHWMDVRSGIRDAARTLGMETVILYPPSENAADQQIAMFYDLVAREPDLILFAACDSQNTAPLLEAARERDVPVLAIDTATEDAPLPYIGADNGYMGVLAAQRLALLLEGEGQVAVISGVREQSSHRERIEGFRRALGEYPGIEVVDTVYADSEFGLAMTCTEEIMENHPTVGGIFCTSAVMGLGAVEQKKIGYYPSDPFLVAVDTQDDALSALEQGALHGLVTQDGYEVGYKALQVAAQLLSGEEIPDRTYISTKLLTKDNVHEYLEERLTG